MLSAGLDRGWALRSAAYLVFIGMWTWGDWSETPFTTARLLLLLALTVGVCMAIVERERTRSLLFIVGLTLGIAWGTASAVAVGLFAYAVHRPLRRALPAMVLGAAGIAVLHVVPEVAAVTTGRVHDPQVAVPTAMVNALFSALAPVVIGTLLRARDTRIHELQARVTAGEAERERREAEAIAREQRRIAQEMHDSLGHKLVLISMRAQVIAAAPDTEPELVEQIADIRHTARAALADLRDVLGALSPAGGVSTIAQPGAEGVAALVRQSTTAGGSVTLLDELTGRPDIDSLPEATGRAVYRVAQEALTNAHKHAPGAPVLIRLSGAPGSGVRVVVENPVDGDADGHHRPDGSGIGLAGLGARVRLLGGTLSTEQGDGAFLLTAQLPWEASVC